MDDLDIFISILAAVGLFSHSLESFSDNLKKTADSKFNSYISRWSGTKLGGLLMGFSGTALIQSSSAIVAITISMVDSGVITFANSLPILLGSNLGTTTTAWLVSFDAEGIGMIFLALGFVMGLMKGKIKALGKSLFYMGLILFSLDLISDNLQPVKDSPRIIEFLQMASNPIIGILLGFVVTAISQSSSVTIGLAVMLAGQGIIDLESGIAIVVGANLGTTSTAFLAAMKLGETAKKTAQANLYFNSVGVLLFLPFSGVFSRAIGNLEMDIAFQVATAHLLFNLIITVVILPFTKQVAAKLMPETSSAG